MFAVFLLTLFLNGDRFLPHVTKPAGGFTTRILIINQSSQTRSFQLEGFTDYGTSLGVYSEAVLPATVSVVNPYSSFGNDIGYCKINGLVQATVEFKANSPHASPAHVLESSLISTRWQIFGGSWETLFDGLAIINTGTSPTSLTLYHRSMDSTLIQSELLTDYLGPQMKHLFVMGSPSGSVFQRQKGDWFELVADEPLSLIALRGSPPNSPIDLLWSNSAIPLTQEMPAPFCRFPTFKKWSGNPLKTKDDGNCDHQNAAVYGGNCENFHIFGSMGDPFVWKENDIFRMGFTGSRLNSDETSTLGTAMGTSDNGFIWDDPKQLTHWLDLVVEPNLSGWDLYGVETVSIVKTDDLGYFLYYTGNLMDSPHSVHSIGLATSPDGRVWKKARDPVVVATLEWEQIVETPQLNFGGPLEPSVLFVDGVFKMWYVGFGVKAGENGYARIGFATSTNGIDWTKHPEPVLSPGPPGSWDDAYVSHTHVIQDPISGYHLFYAGGESANNERMRIGHAFSPDGIEWQKSHHNPIIEGQEGTWDAGMTGGPSAIFINGQLRLYYMGSSQPGFVSPVFFGLALSECP